MSGEPFIDTNILVYVFAEGDPRADVAERLLFEGGYVSVQILNEFTNVLRHKQQRPWSEIHRALAIVRAQVEPPIPITLDIHEKALGLCERYRFGIYDSLIVASALQAGCSILYTEDLQHGQRIDGLTVRNPFTA